MTVRLTVADTDSRRIEFAYDSDDANVSVASTR